MKSTKFRIIAGLLLLVVLGIVFLVKMGADSDTSTATSNNPLSEINH